MFRARLLLGELRRPASRVPTTVTSQHHLNTQPFRRPYSAESLDHPTSDNGSRTSDNASVADRSQHEVARYFLTLRPDEQLQTGIEDQRETLLRRLEVRPGENDLGAHAMLFQDLPESEMAVIKPDIAYMVANMQPRKPLSLRGPFFADKPHPYIGANVNKPQAFYVLDLREEMRYAWQGHLKPIDQETMTSVRFVLMGPFESRHRASNRYKRFKGLWKRPHGHIVGLTLWERLNATGATKEVESYTFGEKHEKYFDGSGQWIGHGQDLHARKEHLRKAFAHAFGFWRTKYGGAAAGVKSSSARGSEEGEEGSAASLRAVRGTVARGASIFRSVYS